MSYLRVIPRDLFNESKLLKCLGRLCLLIHDGECREWGLSFDHDGGPFLIEQNQDDGSLFCPGLSFYVETADGLCRLLVCSRYNSKAAYPMLFQVEAPSGRLVGDQAYLFDEDGVFTPEFKEAIQ